MFLALLYTLSKKKINKKIQHSQMENVPSSIFLGRLCEIVKSLQGMLGEFGMRKLLTHTHTHGRHDGWFVTALFLHSGKNTTQMTHPINERARSCRGFCPVFLNLPPLRLPPLVCSFPLPPRSRCEARPEKPRLTGYSLQATSSARGDLWP